MECVGFGYEIQGRYFYRASRGGLLKAYSATLGIPQINVNGDLRIKGAVYATGTILDAGGNSNHHNTSKSRQLYGCFGGGATGLITACEVGLWGI